MNNETVPSTALPIKGHDPRAAKYETIAKFHKRIVEAKWRASTTGGLVTVNADLVLHCEEAIAFLAEELLELGKKLEEKA